MRKKIWVTIGILATLVLAYWLLSPLWRTVTLNEALPDAPVATTTEDVQTEPSSQNTIISRANMIAEAHDVEGEAFLVTTGEETFLRFENLKTINGPDLRIILSSDLNADEYVDLGPIRATEGNVNYPIPSGIDLEKYPYAIIWCRAFNVLFSYAQLY